MKKLTVGLFNDSFPPTIDGVANVAVNYARIIQRDLGRAVVATPYYPGVTDDYPFEVVRYPSAYIKNEYGYRAGYPFDPKILIELQEKHLDIIHSHCPVISTILARTLRQSTGAPVVFTYHTKFDMDIDNLTSSDTLRRAAIRFLVSNISACDEVWVVSAGAGENLRSLGYEGNYIVMPNGTDFERRRAGDAEIAALQAQHGIPQGVPVFLFVGRMQWYKGMRLSLDGLRRLADEGQDFRFLLVGDGGERQEIADYVRQLQLADKCLLPGAVRDREVLRGYFSLADLFLFPSDFDTNGIVVREAAACACPSLLLRGSCAAEGIADGETGFIIDKNTDSMAAALRFACANPEKLRAVGKNAEERIYLSWDDAVARANDRYGAVLEQHKARREDESVLRELITGAKGQFLDDMHLTRDSLAEILWSTRDKVDRLKDRGTDYTREMLRQMSAYFSRRSRDDR